LTVLPSDPYNGRINHRTVLTSHLIHVSTAVLRYGPKPYLTIECTAVAIYGTVGTPIARAFGTVGGGLVFLLRGVVLLVGMLWFVLWSGVEWFIGSVSFEWWWNIWRFGLVGHGGF
jgi:hypothetical protein